MRAGRADGERWLRLGEAAAELGVSLNTLRRWSDSGTLTCYRSPGGHRRYRREDVQALLLSSENESGGLPRRLPARHAPVGGRDDLRASLLTLARVAAEGVGVSECRVSLVDANGAFRLLIARSRTHGGAAAPEDEEEAGEPLPTVREVLRTGRRLVISDLGSTNLLERSEANALRQRGDAAVLAVPVTVEGRNRAVLELVESRAQRAFNGANVAFAEFMARQAANLLVDGGGDRRAYRRTSRRDRPEGGSTLTAARGPAPHSRRPAPARAGRRRLRRPAAPPRSARAGAGRRFRRRRSAAASRPAVRRGGLRRGRVRARDGRTRGHRRPGRDRGRRPAPRPPRAERGEERERDAHPPGPRSRRPPRAVRRGAGEDAGARGAGSRRRGGGHGGARADEGARHRRPHPPHRPARRHDRRVRHAVARDGCGVARAVHARRDPQAAGLRCLHRLPRRGRGRDALPGRRRSRQSRRRRRIVAPRRLSGRRTGRCRPSARGRPGGRRRSR